MEALVTSVTSGISDMATSAMSAMGAVVPVALPVLGGMVVIGIAIKVFKRVTGK